MRAFIHIPNINIRTFENFYLFPQLPQPYFRGMRGDLGRWPALRASEPPSGCAGAYRHGGADHQILGS